MENLQKQKECCVSAEEVMKGMKHQEEKVG